MTYARYRGIEWSRPRTTLMAGRRKAAHSWCAGRETLHRTHRRIEAMCCPPRETDMVDIRVENHGSVVLLRPLALRAERWLRDSVYEDAMWHGGALVVEPRYMADIVAGSREAGLVVR
jgi:hypothetical protein